jgi:hypothetical protein
MRTLQKKNFNFFPKLKIFLLQIHIQSNSRSSTKLFQNNFLLLLNIEIYIMLRKAKLAFKIRF